MGGVRQAAFGDQGRHIVADVSRQHGDGGTGARGKLRLAGRRLAAANDQDRTVFHGHENW
jgi:hypothetical protein